MSYHKTVNAKHLLELLAERHLDDLFIPECKNGPTQSVRRGEMVRMDAWVANKSWANPCYTCYEIKVSRSDFVQDKKWPRYLPLCNELYFVCPHGLIEPTELPDEVGLIYCSRTGTKLYTKKRAPHRHIDLPLSVITYAMICRLSVIAERQDHAAEWEQWLEDKEARLRIGRASSKKLRQLYEREVQSVKDENAQLTARIRDLERTDATLKELGFTATSWLNQLKVKRKLVDALGVPTREIAPKIQDAITDLQEVQALLKKAG